ncbi:C4-dicarboxylic acid transporter DauA [Phycisphaerae bacterium RAS2]|nr:C4-dicarboxylic acid transporter DauA [Phycisphaerae bacterium RAS2]
MSATQADTASSSKPANGNAPRFSAANLGRDLLASVVVFLVALPLCMGIAIASGVEPAAGIITGIVGGIIVGLLAGAPLQVSGPAAGLSVMVYEIVQREGPKELSGVAILGTIVLIAGTVQLLAGVLKLGQWFRAVSPAVIRGMLSGIGVLIFASQFHVMVDDAPKGSGLANLISIPEAVWKGIVPMDDSPHHFAARVGALTIIAILLWRLVPKQVRSIPGPLVAVLLATLVTYLSGVKINLVPLPDNLADTIRTPGIAQLKGLLDGQIILAGLAVAFVASAETLLCATAVDRLHTGPRCKYDKELAAQGVGNIICGLLGTLPMTGVIVRSAANIDAGGKTRASAILHGIWLLLFAAALPWVLRMIPTASLAGILVFTGWKLIDIKAIRDLRQYGRSEVWIFLATLGSIVAADLLTGVLVGVGLSVAKLLYMFSHLDVRVDDQFGRNRTEMYLRGAATFMALPKLASALETVRSNTELHVHLERLDYIDHACLDLLMNWEKQHENNGGRLVIDWESLTAKLHRQEQETDEGEPPAPAASRTLEAIAIQRNRENAGVGGH